MPLTVANSLPAAGILNLSMGMEAVVVAAGLVKERKGGEEAPSSAANSTSYKSTGVALLVLLAAQATCTDVVPTLHTTLVGTSGAGTNP